MSYNCVQIGIERAAEYTYLVGTPDARDVKIWKPPAHADYEDPTAWHYYGIDCDPVCIFEWNKKRIPRTTWVNAFVATHQGLHRVAALDAAAMLPGSHALVGEHFYVGKVTLETLFNELKLEFVELLAVDIEGFEHQIFSDYSWDKRPRYINVEVHAWRRLTLDEAEAKMRHVFESADYEILQSRRTNKENTVELICMDKHQQVAPLITEEPAPAEVEEPAPAEVEEPAPAEVEEPAPAEVDESFGRLTEEQMRLLNLTDAQRGLLQMWGETRQPLEEIREAADEKKTEDVALPVEPVEYISTVDLSELHCMALTLPDSVHRQAAWLGGMTSMGVPPAQLSYFIGKTASAFNDDLQQLADAADADGYPFVRHFCHELETPFLKASVRTASQIWNHARMLKQIAASPPGLYLILWDDRKLTVPYFALLDVLQDLVTREKPFWMAQLRLRAHPLSVRPELSPHPPWSDIEASWDWDKEYTLPIMQQARRDGTLFLKYFGTQRLVSLEEDQILREGLLGTDLHKNKLDATLPDTADIFFCEGLRGYDEMLVYTPWAAQWVLDDVYRRQPAPDLDKLSEFVYTPDDIMSNRPLTRYMNIDNFMFYEIVPASSALIEAGKGVYTPRSYGYAFVSDWLPQGSQVDWMSETNPENFHHNRHVDVKHYGHD